ncbi:MAG: twin-arginine translocation signal domain-containing protein, partial [Planctomycetota bacterium]
MKLDKDTNKAAVSRRDFIYGAGAAFAALTIVPSHVLGRAGHIPPSETIQVGGIGVGGVGHGQMRSISQQANTKVVALCDVDDVYAERTYNFFPKARRYRN